jgi:hypothetical protein
VLPSKPPLLNAFADRIKVTGVSSFLYAGTTLNGVYVRAGTEINGRAAYFKGKGERWCWYNANDQDWQFGSKEMKGTARCFFYSCDRNIHSPERSTGWCTDKNTEKSNNRIKVVREEVDSGGAHGDAKAKAATGEPCLADDSGAGCDSDVGTSVEDSQHHADQPDSEPPLVSHETAAMLDTLLAPDTADGVGNEAQATPTATLHGACAAQPSGSAHAEVQVVRPGELQTALERFFHTLAPQARDHAVPILLEEMFDLPGLADTDDSELQGLGLKLGVVKQMKRKLAHAPACELAALGLEAEDIKRIKGKLAGSNGPYKKY